MKEEERKRKEKKRKEKKKSVCGKLKGEKKKRAFNFRCYNGWKSIGRELKLFYLTRATSRYQKNKRFDSTLQEVGVFSYTSSFLFKSRKWSCGSAQTQD